MVSPAYTSQSSWDLYEFFVFDQNTSEGICDVLLAVSEAMRQFAPGTSMPESALVELGKHISQQTLKFVKDDIPDLVQDQRSLHKNLWSNRYLASTSRGLKQSIEKITIRFIDDLTKSFSESSTGWTYTPDLVHDAFKELAVSFEDALGREYDDHQKTVTASAANDVAILSASLFTLSISSSQSAASATPAANTAPARSSSSDDCFNCGQPGHRPSECPHPKKGSTPPSKSPPNTSCSNCGKTGHWTSTCPSPQKGSITPPRSSASPPRGNCYTCGQPGHWSSSCPSPRRGSATTPSRTPSSDKCFSCGQTGHWSSNCPCRRQGSATRRDLCPETKCFSSGKIGHWSSNCPTRRNR
jgi:Zinc knuckle